MTNHLPDPKEWFEAYGKALNPLMQSQQEGMKAFDRFAQCHYAAVGECLEFGMAQANAALAAKTPTELVAKEAELGTKFVEKMTARSKEMIQLLTDAQVRLTQMASETAGRAATAPTETTATAPKQ